MSDYNIKLDKISRQEALRYMGNRGEPGENVEKIVENCEKELLGVIRPGFVFRVFDITESLHGIEVCGSSLILRGNDIRSHLEGCTRAVLMCATLGADADRLIRTAEASDISAAFVMDALASAAIEDVCRIVDEYIKNKLPGMYFTWRFSPGYGDFLLDIQKDFLETLSAPKRIGLCTDDNNILVPRKSVTAVSGVSDIPLPKKRRGCTCCNMSENCAFRIRGEHCGF